MKKKLTMKELPGSERPYELLEERGAEALTDAQLLAILLRSGTKDEKVLDLCMRILAEMKDEDPSREPMSALFRLPLYRLRAISGIGRVKSLEIKAVAEIARRLRVKEAGEKLLLRDPSSIAGVYMQEALALSSEYVWYILADTSLHLICRRVLSRGTVNRASINEKEIFLEGQEKGAYGFFILHNHPGGNPAPSPEDDRLTEELRKQGQIMHLPLIDHIIIGSHTYYSYKEDGKL